MGECPEGITPSSGDGFDAQGGSHDVGFDPEEDRGGAAGAMGQFEGGEEGGVGLWGLLCARNYWCSRWHEAGWEMFRPQTL